MLDATAIKTTLTQNGVAQSPCHYDIYGKIEIMSVDDDPINQMVIENLLQPYGYVLTICMDGMQCLELIASRGYTPDLLMLGMLLVRRVPVLSFCTCWCCFLNTCRVFMETHNSASH